MTRKRLTQRFPWLLPLRRKQRIFCFYQKMRFDRNRYAAARRETALPYQVFETRCPMINRQTGFDLQFQENKVFNLKLAAKKLDGLLIRPGETFSFWQAVRGADRETPYKEGLAEVNGRLTTQQGGGLCMLSNLLFWLLLHTPLTVLERHGHNVKDFPEPPSDAPLGVDATVAEGWLDLKVRNDTESTWQLMIGFDKEHIIGRIYTDRDTGDQYKVVNENLCYTREGGRIYEEVEVVRKRCAASGVVTERKGLYKNRCAIGYQLPPETEIKEREQ
ncbi:MAG: glycopeptide resistance accessory protein VanW [Candidatus Limivicinus sp.]